MILATEDDRELNIHLGPSGAVEFVLSQLEKGQIVAIDAFRTDAMPDDHHVAVNLTVGDSTLVLRDDESLRPVWAGGRGAGYGNGRGRGFGHGCGWGRSGGRG